MKKCKIVMTRQSMEQSDTNESHSYIADLAENDKSMALRYSDGHGNRFMVVFNDDVLKLKCEGETKSRLELIENKWTDVELNTPFGIMILKSRAKKVLNTKNSLSVHYELYQGDELVDEIKIRWDIDRTAIS